MRELPNFGHMTISMIQSRDKFLVTSWKENMTPHPLVIRVGIFADIIKIVTMFI